MIGVVAKNPAVSVTLHDDVALITIDNPPVNALGPEVVEGISASIDEVAGNPSIRAAVLIGAGRTFVAGADIKGLEQLAWVSVGPLRSRIIAQGAGLVQDVVIAAPDRDYATALIFPNLVKCRAAASLAEDAPAAVVLGNPVVRAAFQSTLDALAAQSTGSSTYVTRAVLLVDPPSMEAREITDKGSINQKSVLQHRAALVDELYAESPGPAVLVAKARRV